MCVFVVKSDMPAVVAPSQTPEDYMRATPASADKKTRLSFSLVCATMIIGTLAVIMLSTEYVCIDPGGSGLLVQE